MINTKLMFTLLGIVLMGAGCGGLPIDTLNKRLAAFEISYEQILITVERWIDEGRLTGADKEKIQAQIKATRQARLAVYMAKAAGDVKTAQGKLGAATASLQVIRDYLASHEPNEQQTRLDAPSESIARWHWESRRRQGLTS